MLTLPDELKSLKGLHTGEFGWKADTERITPGFSILWRGIQLAGNQVAVDDENLPKIQKRPQMVIGAQ
jgi:hypothetical protein